MPNSYSFFPAYDERKRTMPNYRVDAETITVVEDGSAPDTFDPGGHNATDVKAYVEAHPDEREAVLAAEQDGKNRVTLVDWLSSDGS